MILLINDDGLKAPGLRTLYRAIRAATRQPVLAVAPAHQHSGQSQAITLDRGLAVTPTVEDNFFGFAVDGTPADCLKLAVKVIATSRPRLVVSGINDGPNVGRSLFYSGTVGAALEAAIEGFPAVALSRDREGEGDLDIAAKLGARIVSGCLGMRDLRGKVLNINIPATLTDPDAPVVMARHGHSGFEERYSANRDRDGRLLWHLHGTRVELEHEGVTDAHLLRSGQVTGTVLSPDLNAETVTKLDAAIAKRIGAVELAAS